MAVPGFQTFFYPFLKYVSDGKEYSFNEVLNYLADFFKLSEEDKAERVPSGVQTKLYNRTAWAKSYLSKAKLIEVTRRSHFKISDRGKDFLNKFHGNFSINDLNTLEEFRDLHTSTTPNIESDNNPKQEALALENQTPLERLEESYQIIQNELANELLEKIKNSTWQFFEDLVIDIMVKMGYGGSRNKAGETIKRRSSDEGIDGIIYEDKLGLDVIYLQAKKWTSEGGIGRPEIQKFVGALQGQRAKKGVFITTSHFSKNAYDYVNSIDSKVILIDGNTLAKLMIEYNVGTSTIESYHIKKIDLDYFED